MKQYEKPDTIVINISFENAFCQLSGGISSGGHGDSYDFEGGAWD